MLLQLAKKDKECASKNTQSSNMPDLSNPNLVAIPMVNFFQSLTLGSAEPKTPGPDCLEWHLQFLALIEAKPFSLNDLLLLPTPKKDFALPLCLQRRTVVCVK